MEAGIVRIAALHARAVLARGALAAQASIPSPTQPKPRLLAVWCESIETLGTHAVPLLLAGVIGFAMVPLLSSALMVVSVPLARIVITQLAARPRRFGNLRGRWGVYVAWGFVVSGVYMAATLAGHIGLSVPLRAWGLNLNFADQKSATWESAAQTITMRSINALSNTADLPFKDALRNWRNWVFDEWVQQHLANYEQKLMSEYWLQGPTVTNGSGVSEIEKRVQMLSLSRPDLRLLFITGVMMIFLVETLFAFRSVPGVKPAHLLWLSLKHFGIVAGHLWFLRLVIVGLKALFVFVPIVIVDRYSYLARDWGWFGSAMQGYALAICLALINAFASSFEAVYVARLHLALTHPTEIL